MRIVFLGNNWLGWQALEWLHAQGEDIAGLVTHPPGRQKYGDEIRAAAHLPPEHVFDAATLRHPDTLTAIRALEADIALSVLFGYILKPDFLSIFPQGVVNLHPAYLPYNRGAYPNVWAIVDGTPAGTTLHYIDPGIDTGDIIARRQVPVEPVDTGRSLYGRLEQASLDLLKETWPLIRRGEAPRISQPDGEGTHHFVRDVEQIDAIDLDEPVTARRLIDVLRARTFPPYDGAYFVDETGRKVYLRLELTYADDDSGGAAD